MKNREIQKIATQIVDKGFKPDWDADIDNCLHWAGRAKECGCRQCRGQVDLAKQRMIDHWGPPPREEDLIKLQIEKR